jgi:DNA-binding transcriptional LysR family regulator
MGRAPVHWESHIARHLKLRDLHILAAVVQWGSMAKAARHLAMSQPAVSESVANLESALRVRLVDRSPRGVEATAYAHALLKRGVVAFDELRQAIRDIEFLADPTVGEIRVASGDTLAGGLMSAVIDQLSRSHPKIVIRVIQANAETADFRELRERRVDLALARIPGSLQEDDLDVEFLFEDPHRIVVGIRSPWARRRKVALAELTDEPWIFASNQVVREMVAEAFKARGLELPQERVTCSSILLRNHLLATGRFLTVLPLSVLRYNAKLWSLKALPIDLGVKPRSVAILTLRNRIPSPVVQLFIEAVRGIAKTIVDPSRAGR